MNILRVITSMDPKIGGPTEGIRQIQNALSDGGYDVNCEIACMDNPDSPWIENSSTTIHALGKKASTYSYSKKFSSWLDANVSKFDLVIIHGIWQYHSYAAYRACYKNNIPYYLYTHGMLDPWFKETYPLKHLKKMAYWLMFEQKVVNNAKGVIFTCEEEKILARKSFPVYSPNEIVTSYGTLGSPISISKDDAIASFNERFPELKDKKIILFMGRLHEKKGCDILLNSFARVSNSIKNIHLMFAGPNDSLYAKKLIEESENLGIKELVTWAGMLQGKLKWGAYYCCNVFCLPSHQENFGIVVAEALSCSKAVLISDKVNIWREIEATRAGIISRDDITSVSEVIKQWFNLSIEEVTDYNNNAYICFKEKFDIRIAASRFMEIIES